CGWRRPRRAERGGAGRPWRPACVPAWWLSLPSSPWWSSPAWPPWRTLRTSWSGRSCWVSWGAWGSWGGLVVAAAEELEQAPAVPERVGQPCDAPPRGFAHLAFGAGAGSEGAGQGRVQVIDHDIQMEWGPVSVVVAPRITGGDGAGRLAQQVDGSLRAEHLDPVVAEAARRRQPEGIPVEGFGAGQVVDVDVDQQVHGVDFAVRVGRRSAGAVGQLRRAQDIAGNQACLEQGQATGVPGNETGPHAGAGPVGQIARARRSARPV